MTALGGVCILGVERARWLIAKARLDIGITPGG
jgi:hypothetical protein